MNLAAERREDRQLRRLYASSTLAELAEEFGYAPATVARKIRAAGGTIRKLGEAQRKRLEPQNVDLMRLCGDNIERGLMTVRTVAAVFDLSEPTCRRILRELGFKTPRQR